MTKEVEEVGQGSMESGGTERVWLVTGCSGGFGRAFVRAIVAAGDRVIATARQVSDIAVLESEGNGRVRIMKLDLTDAGQVTSVIKEAVAVWGGLDVLVNNAGYALFGAVEECDEAAMRRCMEVNFWGPLRLVRAVLPEFRLRGGGHVIQMSAAAALGNYAGLGIYGAAKCALEGLSEALEQELRPQGIALTIVQPGPFRTEFVRRSMERAESPLDLYQGTCGKFFEYLKKVDGKQPGDPDRAAQCIVRLVRSGEAPFRLTLGRYATAKAKKRWSELEANTRKWESVGLSTDGVPLLDRAVDSAKRDL